MCTNRVGQNQLYMVFTVQTLYHRAKISFFALRGDCAHKKSFYFGGAGLKNGGFWRILEPVRQKSLCGVGVN
jgi:hypothetical protein